LERARAAGVPGRSDIVRADERGLDLDRLATGGILDRPHADPPLALDHLARLLDRPDLLPDALRLEPGSGPRERILFDPAHPRRLRVTADAAYFEMHSESCELFSPGSPVFPSPHTAPSAPRPDRETFERLLGGGGRPRTPSDPA
jgi:hypothetical protein